MIGVDVSGYTIRTQRQTTSAYLTAQRNAGRNMVAAINASPWAPFSTLQAQQNTYSYADQLGLAISEGVEVSPYNTYPTFAFYKDWTADFLTANATTDTSNILTAVSGFAFILVNNSTTGDAVLNPRTGYGLSKDRRTLFLVTIDGRQSNSLGATTREVAEWLRYLGAWSGLNMDGGGSTTMALRNPQSGSIQVLNSPSDGSQRNNGNNLGIYYISQPEQISFDNWLAYRGVAAADRGLLADPNADGTPNLLGYALNIHPIQGIEVPGGNARPQYSIYQQNGTTCLAFDYRVNRYATGINVQVVLSETLAQNSWVVPGTLVVTPNGNDPVTKDPIYRATVEIAGLPRAFLRLNVSPQNP